MPLRRPVLLAAAVWVAVLSSASATTIRRTAVAFEAGGRSVGVAGALPVPELFHTGRLGAEPAIGVDSVGRVFFNYVVGLAGGATLRPGVLETTDGAKFSDVSPELGRLRAHPVTNDPYLYVDPATGRVFEGDLLPPCSALSYSDDQGRTWTNSLAGCTQADHETIFAGPAPAGSAKPTGYPNVVYYCSIGLGAAAETSFGTECSKSLDGGWVFTPIPSFPYLYNPTVCRGVTGGCDGGVGHGFVAADGSVYLPKGYAGQPHLAISRDEGSHWTVVQVAATGMNTNGDGSPDHEASVVADASGDVYYVWVARNRLPYLAVSQDRGLKWSVPMEIGVPGLHQADQPVMAIGATGAVAVFYMGSTNAPLSPFPDDSECPPSDLSKFLTYEATNSCAGADAAAYAGTTWNGYIVETTDALSSNPTFYGAAANNPADPMVIGTCGPTRCQQEFDFEGIAISHTDGYPWAAFVDGCPHGQPCPQLGQDVLGRLVGGPRLYP